jgi:hypothetical protein
VIFVASSSSEAKRRHSPARSAQALPTPGAGLALSDDASAPGNDPAEVCNNASAPGNDPTEAGNDPAEADNDPTEACNDRTEVGNDRTEVGNDRTEVGNDASEVCNYTGAHVAELRLVGRT